MSVVAEQIEHNKRVVYKSKSQHTSPSPEEILEACETYFDEYKELYFQPENAHILEMLSW